MISWLFKKNKEVEPVIQYKVVDKTITVEKYQHPVKLLLITNETVTEYLPIELCMGNDQASLVSGEIANYANPNYVERKLYTHINVPNEIRFYSHDRPYTYDKVITIGNKSFNINHVISYEVLPKVKTGEEEVTYRALEKI